MNLTIYAIEVSQEYVRFYKSYKLAFDNLQQIAESNPDRSCHIIELEIKSIKTKTTLTSWSGNRG